MLAVLIGAFALFCGLVGYVMFSLWKDARAARAMSARYQPIADIQAELDAMEQRRTKAIAVLHELSSNLDAARLEIEQVTNTGEMQAIGLYRKSFDFSDAAEYRSKLDLLRDKQEAMVKAGLAAVCSQAWTINGSAKEGKRVTDKILKLMLRAFNGECDALIGRVKYDNVNSFNLRIQKAFASINKLGGGFSCSLTTAYLKMKLDELAMVHEYQEQMQQEREEQRQIREQMREEEKRVAELEKLRREGEADENRYGVLLLRAREEAVAAEGERRQKLEAHIAELQENLRVAREKSERAKTMAQLTRAGHVYVLSNIGSFGEHVYKVGMTRRLDPRERVQELGDASVPFGFDVHAMIYCEDAPKLEHALHGILEARRVNMVNNRKEFFRATIDEIEASVRKHHGEFKLTKLAEAVEYRKTLGIVEAATAQSKRAS